MPELGRSARLPGLVCTFYSYKGGVGRSMALANVGVLMATEGHRVLLVDWDLEAPGLEVFFRNAAKLDGDTLRTAGVVDLLIAHTRGTPLAWKECLLKAKFFGNSLDIMTSGRRTDDYRQRVQQLDWSTLYSEHQIGNYIDALRKEWREEYDFVLIDSRTGITDIGDVCTVILPDVLVLFFVTNYQNVEGIKNVVSRAVKARSKLPVNRNKLLGVPVPSRDERYHDYDKSVEWQHIFAKEFSDLYREWLPKEVNPLDALNHIFLPYVSGWSFGERIPVIESERERADPTSLGAAYARLATLLSRRLDWSAIEAKATSADVVGTRVELSRAREAELRLGEEAKRLEEEVRLQAAKQQKLESELERNQAATAHRDRLTLLLKWIVGIFLAVAVAIGVFSYFRSSKVTSTSPDVYSQGQLVVRGTWACDLDAGAEATQMGRADFWWEQVNEIKRDLVPRNGAEFFVLGVRDFDSIGYTDLQRLSYSTEKIEASATETDNRIPSGTAVAYTTKDGRLGKFRVEEYGYNLRIRWVTYKSAERVVPSK